MKETYKLQGITFTKEELIKAMKEDNIYIVKYRTVAQIHYSENAGFYSLELYYHRNTNNVPLTLRGRYFLGNASFVNRLVDFKLVKEF